MMNSIERVRAAINFDSPDRAPVFRVGGGDVFVLIHVPSRGWMPGHAEYERGLFPFHGDDLAIKLGLWRWKKPGWARAPEYRKWLRLPREEVDEFGCIWNREGRNLTMGHPGRPAIEDWSDFDTYLQRYSPDPEEKSRYSPMIRLSRLAGRNQYRMCQLSFPGPVNVTANIRGFTNFLIDHRRNPDELKRLLAHMTDFNVRVARSWVKYGGRPHGFIIYDDLGAQTGPFFSPKMFEEFYRPVYKTIIDTAHELGCDMHLHSCGRIDSLMPLLMEWGLDAFEFDSPRTIGYPGLERFRGQIMMWGCVDIQKIYTVGTPEQCDGEVWQMMKGMGTPRGGYGAYFYPATYHIGAPKQNVRAFRRGLKKYGNYSKIPAQWWEVSETIGGGESVRRVRTATSVALSPARKKAGVPVAAGGHGYVRTGMIIGDAIRICRRNPASSFGLAALVGLAPFAMALLGMARDPRDWMNPKNALPGLLQLVLLILTVVYVTYMLGLFPLLAAHDLAGRPTFVKAAFSWLRERNLFRGVLLVVVLSALAALGGLLLLVLPGIYLSVIFMLAIPARVLGGYPGRAALAQSGRLIRPVLLEGALTFAGVLFVPWLAVIVVQVILGAKYGINSAAPAHVIPAALVTYLVTALWVPIDGVAHALLYIERSGGTTSLRGDLFTG